MAVPFGKPRLRLQLHAPSRGFLQRSRFESKSTALLRFHTVEIEEIRSELDEIVNARVDFDPDRPPRIQLPVANVDTGRRCNRPGTTTANFEGHFELRGSSFEGQVLDLAVSR